MEKITKQRVVFTSLLILYIAAIVIFAILPAIIIRDINYLKFNDKLLHFFEFLILGVLLCKTLMLYKIKVPWLISFVLAGIIGIFSEIIQLYVVTRSYNWVDFSADMTGIVLGILMAIVIR